MSCERFRFRLSLLQDDSVPSDTPRWVWDHVAQCGACRSFQVVTLGLAEEYRMEVWSRVQALNRLEGTASREFPFPRRRRAGAVILTAALPILLIGIWLSRDRAVPESPPAPSVAGVWHAATGLRPSCSTRHVRHAPYGAMRSE